MARPTVFISYSHKDKEWKNRVLTYLGGLELLDLLDLRHDRRIRPGDEWRVQLEQAMDVASVALLLVSQNFLNSKYIMKTELPRLSQRRDRDGVRIIPLILRPCDWQASPLLSELEPYPKDGRPLSMGGHNQIDKDLAELAKEIRQLLEPVSQTLSPGEFPPLPPSKIGPPKLPMTGKHFLARSKQLARLNEAWTNPKTHVISVVAMGGVGKTALVKHWLGLMSADNFRGADRYFEWSFYSQGTSDKPASATPFINEALEFFGYPQAIGSNPWEQGKRLAELIASSRTLLVLDGLEPLQDVSDGTIKDQALATLIKGLAASNQGLCIITTRKDVAELGHLENTTAPRIELKPLLAKDGARLLSKLGVRGEDKELREASDAFDGHALALTLLGTGLAKFCRGDVSGWRKIPLLRSDKTQGRHARRVLRSYEKWMLASPEGQASWSVLRLMGFFDRPAKESEINALLKKPPIEGLTDSVVGLDREAWQNISFDLIRLGLLMDVSDSGGMDAHPLIREYLTEDLRERLPRAWKEGNRRLYLHLKGSADQLPKTGQQMIPYYQAIAHGCSAGLHDKAFKEVYMHYIRQDGSYNTDILRDFGQDRAALSNFLLSNFLQDGRFKVVSKLKDQSSFILGEIGFDLRTLARLGEAAEYMSAALEWDKAQGGRDHRINAARQADLLSTTYLSHGRVSKALEIGDEAVDLAKDDPYHKMICLTTRADARHRANYLSDAGKDFEEAESITKRIFSKNGWSYLRSFQGFRYCDYLLTLGCVREVRRRVEKIVKWDEAGGYPTPKSSIRLHALQTEGSVLPLTIAHLMFARALLAEDRVDPGIGRGNEGAEEHLNKAFEGIKKSETEHLLPGVLLVRAELFRTRNNAERAKDTLLECKRICDRYEMGLYNLDCQFALASLRLKAQEDVALDAVSQSKAELEQVREMADQLGYGLLRNRVTRLLADGYDLRKP